MAEGSEQVQASATDLSSGGRTAPGHGAAVPGLSRRANPCPQTLASETGQNACCWRHFSCVTHCAPWTPPAFRRSSGWARVTPVRHAPRRLPASSTCGARSSPSSISGCASGFPRPRPAASPHLHHRGSERIHRPAGGPRGRGGGGRCVPSGLAPALQHVARCRPGSSRECAGSAIA